MLKNKTVIVTGAAKGIGRAIALRFAKEGCNIVLNYRSTVSDELIDEIKSYGVECMPYKADVSVYSEAEALIKDAKKQFGSVDVLVNNAGITRDMLLMRMSEEEFDSVINTNLKGAFNTIRHVSSVMLKQRSGAIINLSSVVGLMGNIGQANYAASKAGVIGLTKSAARELAARGITCNAIAPGFIETDMTAVLKEETKEAMLNTIPLKKFGSAEDVAEAVVFLAKNRYITGQVLNVDGGMVMN
ncbi:3-oxoacyl-[acyl-carrier-protein] reductase [Tyzzerella sp. An114]|uniref:3-oxoacyl-[acyl-carrier-protein] reductase n=1 Tax=Tyzzerella sp. An114 TaxID=1965545 RepID=UPI000B44C7DA|nr:3-oxoacyl-[acyl-carrier-protein] reductase [Tyzzerella sp. An114]OUQ59656.1 3-oxoacyl-[acyl-carrier-protein] reductase [Tyzzerella sp. An114]HIT73845.1 3-oxoacyl-[acyl-carrier-protein] reductase [Candidatus Fimicola cottocaccae]